MDGNITLKSVLIECLGIIKEEQRLSSKDYNGLVPKEGMEESWDQARRKVQVLKDAIPALESEPVRVAMANWQKDVMQNGPGPLDVTEKRTVYIPKHLSEEEKRFLIEYIEGHFGLQMETNDPTDTAKQTLGEEPMRF